MLTDTDEHYISLQGRQSQYTRDVPQLQTEYKTLAHLASRINLDGLERVVIPLLVCIRS